MTVRTLYFGDDVGADTGLGFFFRDVRIANDEAGMNGDTTARQWLRSLWVDFFDVQLPAKGTNDLIAYLESRSIWWEEADRPVYKTVDQPCIAYTAYVLADGSVDLIALAACYRYPGGDEETWWQTVIRPRVITI